MAYKRPFVPLQSGSTRIGESLWLGPILPSRKLRLRQAQHRARGNLPASQLYLLCQPFSQPTKGCGHSIARLGARGWIGKGWQAEKQHLLTAPGSAASLPGDFGEVCCLLCVSFFLRLKRRRWTKYQVVKQAHVWSQLKPGSLLIIRMQYIRGVLLSDAPNDTDGPVL